MGNRLLAPCPGFGGAEFGPGLGPRLPAGSRFEGSGPVAELGTLGIVAIVWGGGAVRSCWEHRGLWGSRGAAGLAVHAQGVQTRTCIGNGKQGPDPRTGCPGGAGEGVVGGKEPVMQAPPALGGNPVLRAVTSRPPESQPKRAVLTCVTSFQPLSRDSFFRPRECNVYIILHTGQWAVHLIHNKHLSCFHTGFMIKFNSCTNNTEEAPNLLNNPPLLGVSVTAKLSLLTNPALHTWG